jgi:uncharacterized protein (TIRG00374 family)
MHLLPWLRRGGLLVIAVVAVEYLVLPKLVGASDDLSLLRSAEPALLVVALALEASSLTCYSLLSRTTLPERSGPTFSVLLRVDLTGFGLSHVAPGGGATAAALRFRLLTQAGVRPEDAIAGAAVQTAAEVITLVGLFASGAVLSFQRAADHALYAAAGWVALALLVAVIGGAVLLLSRAQATQSGVHRWLARLPPDVLTAADATATGLIRRVARLAHDRVLLTRTLGWAVTNWALDAASLWCCLCAYGFSAPVGPLLAVYGAVSLLALLPVTPAGLGVVEGVLIPAVASLGAASSVALLGVLTWRLVQFWLPVPVALGTYTSLRLGALRHGARSEGR